ncbi:EsaB/YukD family protein [Filibacter tadaridae]|uniref:Putative ubiquitin-like protein YukD n=1 Tax=Filibacter tadaridae TaxID=2483811 RepID=A0A3P5X2T9_9BACL|nr:EsaB/YukD family protein [Filibacter tadaridae]VDC24856.1 putative ubiquitin-like protein YukD [Filibacter tadaridae]
MYIEVTVDLTNYEGTVLDLRLSDRYTVKKLLDIAWQTTTISRSPREGHWVRVVNKNKLFPGHLTLTDCGVTTGDRIEII